MSDLINKDKVNWVYIKLYIGKNLDRLDQLVVKVARTVEAIEGVEKWFFIRYFDETGVHIRLRVRSLTVDEQTMKDTLQHLCAPLLNSLHELLPSTYYPMVTPNGFEDANEMSQAMVKYQDVSLQFDEYAPEFDKYGDVLGVKIAEDVFQVSSEIAADVLADEQQGFSSRKDMVPMFMEACSSVFIKASKAEEFWKEYAYYWLGGNTPASNDWREKFSSKGQELKAAGVSVISAALDERKAGYLKRWKEALSTAANKYHEVSDAIEFSEEVLAFNFAHLMNNRLGIASLEEAYMATLLEAVEQSKEVV